MSIKLNDRCANFKVAMNIAEMPVDDVGIEFIVGVFDLLNQKRGEATIREILKLKNKIISKYVVDAQQQQLNSMNDINDENINENE